MQVFIGESRENLESASQELLAIQSSGPASERVDKIFRDLHTIKGSSDLFDIKPLTRLAHAAEDLLDSVRSNEVTYSDDIGDLLLEALDQISIWFDELEVGSQDLEKWKPISTQLSAQLRHFIDPTTPSNIEQSNNAVNNEGVVADAQALSEEQIALLASFGENAELQLLCKATGSHCYFINYTPDEGCFFRGEDPINVAAALPGLKALEIEIPELAEDADIYNCFTSIKALGAASEDAVKQHMAYYEGQYSYVIFSIKALQAACVNKIQKCVKHIDDNTLTQAINEKDIEQVHASAGLLLASLNFDDSENASANKAVLSVLSSIDDVSFLDNESRDDESLSADINTNVSSEVGLSKANETGDSKGEASKPKTLALHERAMLKQQLTLLNSDNYKSELMFPSIAGLVGNILGASFENEDALAVAISNALDEETIQEQANDEQAQQTSNDATAEATQPANAPEPTDDIAAPVKAERQAVKMLKVDQSKIDYLMDIVGELTVAKNSLPYLAKQAEEEGGGKKLSKQIKAHFSIVNRLTESLQSAVLQIRMVPVSHVFQRYPRLVRDLARKLDKKTLSLTKI